MREAPFFSSKRHGLSGHDGSSHTYCNCGPWDATTVVGLTFSEQQTDDTEAAEVLNKYRASAVYPTQAKNQESQMLLASPHLLPIILSHGPLAIGSHSKRCIQS